MAKNAIFSEFLRTDRPNLVHKIFSEDLQYTIWIQNMFKWIRSIIRTNSRPIWTRICEDMAIFKKNTSNPPFLKFPYALLSNPASCRPSSGFSFRFQNGKSHRLLVYAPGGSQRTPKTLCAMGLCQ